MHQLSTILQEWFLQENSIYTLTDLDKKMI
jgi:hypothetical protein